MTDEKEVKSASFYQCNECGRLHKDKKESKKCCINDLIIEKKIYQCKLCGNSDSDKNYMLDHHICRHDNTIAIKVFYCPKCNKTHINKRKALGCCPEIEEEIIEAPVQDLSIFDTINLEN